MMTSKTPRKPAAKKPVARKPATRKAPAKKPVNKRSTPVKRKPKESSAVAVKKTPAKRQPQKKNATSFKKGGKAGPGRPKGQTNKMTKEIKDCILEAFNVVGGTDYLVGVARSDPKTFLALVGKILPAEIKGELTHKGDVTIVVDTGVRSRPPAGVDNPKLKLIGSQNAD